MRDFQISGYENSYQSYPIRPFGEVNSKEFPVTDPESEKRTNSGVSTENPEGKAAEQRRPVSQITPEDLPLKFNRGEDYSYIGKDRDLANLDMQKAISDMKKDSMLQQYQFFIGRSNNLAEGKAIPLKDGIVIPKFEI